jgi:hypothetical protein
VSPNDYRIKPHSRGWVVMLWRGKAAGWVIGQTFTSLIAARSWVSDHHA